MVRIGPLEFPEAPLLLAPMEDVSDPPFRRLCKEQGADLLYTEFISSEGLIRDAAKSVQKLDIFNDERPVGIQIFGGNQAAMAQAARIVEKVQPDILDINYGCPVKKVVNKAAGAGILRNCDKMESLTRAVVQSTHLPVTVKTRLGWDDNSIQIVDVARRLQDAGIQALAIHGRTRKQMYKGEADWSYIQQVKEHPDIEIPIFGNGDIDSPEKALRYLKTYKVDGLMIGRATIGNPWFFREVKHYFKTGELLPPPSLAEKAQTAKRHLEMSVAWKGESLGIVEMRRHYSNYFRGIHGFKPVRMRLVTSLDLPELYSILDAVAEGAVPELALAA